MRANVTMNLGLGVELGLRVVGLRVSGFKVFGCKGFKSFRCRESQSWRPLLYIPNIRVSSHVVRWSLA